MVSANSSLPVDVGGAFVLLLLAAFLGCFVHAADEAQLVTNLKGQPPVNFKQYAGYVTVNEANGRALFYWFFEADQAGAARLPLAVWLNGGPGCSSVGNGVLTELGPFFPDSAGNLNINPFSWTKAANIIFLESPVGTGFSYSNTTSDYNLFTDEASAQDAFSFLVGWFKKFPEYITNDFYLLGESYAGHYIPTFARLIVQNNKLPNAMHINFKGFAIGNPWTDAYYDNLGTTAFYHSHSLISDETFNSVLANCDFAYDLPVDEASTNETCIKAVEQLDADISEINVYNIYATFCNSNGVGSPRKKAYHLTAAYSPCIDSVNPYLNNPEVQRALHVSPPVAWSGCSNTVFSHYKRGDVVASMLPVYRQLLTQGLNIWIYSGDVDGVVATSATRGWIRQLNLSIEMPWYAWKFENQVGGWTQKYSGMTFSTVRGAGHMVPSTRPAQALALFRAFLAGGGLPSF